MAVSEKQMLLEHASLCSAVAQLMNGNEPVWDTLHLSRETRNRIADSAARMRAPQRMESE